MILRLVVAALLVTGAALPLPVLAQDIFAPPVQPYPDRAVDVISVAVAVDLRTKPRVMQTRLTADLRTTARGVRSIMWPAAGATIDSLRVTTALGDTLGGTWERDSIRIDFGGSLPVGTAASIAVWFTQEPGGAFEASEDPAAPGACCVWTGERWLPLPNDPGERFRATLSVMVPNGWRAISGGRQVTDSTGYHFGHPRTVRVQDLAFAAGSFEASTQDRTEYFFGAGAGASLGHLSDTVAGSVQFLTDRTGYRLPWDTLRVVFLPGAPTRSFPGLLFLDEPTPARLTDPIAAVETAQAVARQWTHGVLAPDWWSEVWVVEALAGTFGLLYAAENLDDDVTAAARLGHTKRYLAEAMDYQRPLVWDRFHSPSDLLDEHAQSKGTLVLSQLANRMGPQAFWAAMRRLLARHAFQTVDSDKLAEALAPAGRSAVSAVFDAWVFGAGHPRIELNTQFDGASGEFLVSMEQVQEGPLVPGTFPILSAIEWQLFDGSGRQQVTVTSQSSQVILEVGFEPRYFALDPEGLLPADIIAVRDLAQVSAQLRFGSPASRLRAVAMLPNHSLDPVATLSLRLALANESSAVVRQALMMSAGALDHTASLERLVVSRLNDPDPLFRWRAVEALASLAAPGTADHHFMRVAQEDGNAAVQAAAVRAMSGDGADGLARAALITPSEGNVILRAGVAVLNRIGADVRDDWLDHTGSGRSPDHILAAMPLANSIATSRPVRIRLLELMAHPDVEVRVQAARASAVLLRPGNLPAVRRLIAAEWHGRARDALEALAEAL